MIKSNTFVFLVALSFLFLLFWFVYHDFKKQLSKVTLQSFENSSEEHGEYNGSDSAVIVDHTDLFYVKQFSIDDWLPPCHSFGKMRWLHDTETGECYEEGTVGPCGESMTFYQHPNSKYHPHSGFCDCDDIVEVKSSNPGCETVERPLVYDSERQRCYAVFSRGPCKEHEWLILNETYSPICEINHCKSATRGSKEGNVETDEFSLEFWTSHKRKCYQTMTRGYCNKGEVLKVTKNSWKPDCQKEMQGMCPEPVSVGIPILKCREGNKLHQEGMCFYDKS